jgi:heme exporter protein C
MTIKSSPHARRTVVWIFMTGLCLTGSLLAVAVAPTEQTMGDVQRIMYMHISVAWLGLAFFVATAASGLGYLLRRQLVWDDWARATCEVGWLCSTLTLVTGSLWARAAWGTWWTWDPRLLTSLILWAFYSGNLVLRSGLEDPHRSARLAAVLALIGLADVPLVVMATRWFRGIHPVAPPMEPAMRLALLAMVAGLTAVMMLLVVQRRNQLRLELGVTQLQIRLDEI